MVGEIVVDILLMFGWACSSGWEVSFYPTVLLKESSTKWRRWKCHHQFLVKLTYAFLKRILWVTRSFFVLNWNVYRTGVLPKRLITTSCHVCDMKIDAILFHWLISLHQNYSLNSRKCVPFGKATNVFVWFPNLHCNYNLKNLVCLSSFNYHVWSQHPRHMNHLPTQRFSLRNIDPNVVLFIYELINVTIIRRCSQNWMSRKSFQTWFSKPHFQASIQRPSNPEWDIRKLSKHKESFSVDVLNDFRLDTVLDMSFSAPAPSHWLVQFSRTWLRCRPTEIWVVFLLDHRLALHQAQDI